MKMRNKLHWSNYLYLNLRAYVNTCTGNNIICMICRKVGLNGGIQFVAQSISGTSKKKEMLLAHLSYLIQ